MSVDAEPAVLGGRYVLGDLLGSGGMARVYRARDTVLDREVAVKVFRNDEVLPDAETRRGGEVRLLAGLSHPGLVVVFDAGRDDSDPYAAFSYLIMELVEGTTLARVLDSGPMPSRRVAALGAQLAGALGYVHERGIVHRDVKPANVLIDDGIAKLTDFGVARLVDSTRLTLDGTTLGTANYLAPEQATGADVTAASDVYSLGLVLLECLTGAVAYPGSGVAAAVARLHRNPDLPAWLDDGWRTLLAAMTAREPGQRPSAGEVAVRLAGLAATAAPSVAAPSVGAPSVADTAPTAAVAVPTGRRHSRAVVAFLAAAAAVTAVVVVSTSGSSDPVSAATSTTYPQVVGTLGRDLKALEALAPQDLSPGITTVARRSAVHDFDGAQRALSRVLDDLGALHAQGRVDDASYARDATAIARVSSDLMRGQLSLDAASRKVAARELARSAASQAAAARRSASAARSAAASRSAAAQAAAQRRAARQAARQAAARAAQRRANWYARHASHGHGHGHGHGGGNDQGD